MGPSGLGLTGPSLSLPPTDPSDHVIHVMTTRDDVMTDDLMSDDPSDHAMLASISGGPISDGSSSPMKVDARLQPASRSARNASSVAS
jgi:hypothetical protein